MRVSRKSFLHSLSAAAAIVLSGTCLSVQAGQIPADSNPDIPGDGGWNRDNVNVRILDANGLETANVVWPATVFPPVPAGGSYVSDIYDTTFTDDMVANEILMSTLVAKDPPVGVPPGLKVLNDQIVEPSQPESCIMATAVGITCGSGFQTHKRFKVLMQPSMVDVAGSDSVDLVFDASNIGDPVEEYRVFQKINNWTDERLEGFRLEVGFGVGTGFQKATDFVGADLSVEVDQYFTDPNKKTNFAHGLFGPIEGPNWSNTGEFTGGFFDDQSRAGYRIQEVDTATYESIPDGTTGGIFGAYENVLADDPASEASGAGFGQFGPWIPTAFLPQGLFFDDDDNPNTDDVLMAWWGYNANCSTAPTPVNYPGYPNYCWMYGDSDYYTWIDALDPALGFVKDVITTNYQPVSRATFDAWISDPRYYVDTVDDLANLNLNYVVNVGDVTTWPVLANNTFTIRVTPIVSANSIARPGYIYLGSPHVPLQSTNTVGTVSILPSPEFLPGRDVLTLTVSDTDLNLLVNTAETVPVDVSNATTLETETIMLTETGLDTGVFAGTLPTMYGDDTGNIDPGTLYAQAGEVVEVTYNDANPFAAIKDSTTAIAGYDGAVQFTGPVYPNGNISLQVDDLDLTAATITVTVVNMTTNPIESEVVTLAISPIIGQNEYVGNLATTSVAGSGDNDGTMSVAVGDMLEVTYIDADTANPAVKDEPRIDQVTVTAAPVVGGGGGGGCTLAVSGNSNVTLPGLLLMILGLGWLRHTRRRARS